MADGDFPQLVSATRDANSLTNQMFFQLTDGTNGASVDGSGNLQVILAANSGVDIGDVDVTSVIPGTGAINLGKAIDSVGGATDTGVATLVIRDDALTTLTPVDGDYVALRVDSTGALWVNTGATSDPSNVVADDSAFTVAVGTVGVVGMLADDTATDSVDEGDVGVPRMTLSRLQLGRIVGSTDANRWEIDGSGNGVVILAANDGVDIGDVDVTSVIPGVSATNLGKAVDSVAGGTDTGVLELHVVDAVLSAITPIDGDYAQSRVDANGALWTNDVTLDANGETTPLFVQVVNTAVSGSEVHDRQTTVSVAGDGTTNHDYTVTGTTFLVKSVIWSSSGGSKLEMLTGPVASLAIDVEGFIAKEGGVKQLFFDPSIEVPVTSTGTIRRTITNRQGQPQDLYSTLIGNDVA